ncbi:unnamed protein product [Anisakis simplex]|uniref:SSD domain-containing protein n=1 Tax=Anisakis simplex TaxID=6269 RepID=A0A0M3JQX4_ANISI|nr:unnamed protein product [Anisakis simplex]
MQSKNNKAIIERKQSVIRKHQETRLCYYTCAIFRRWAYLIADHTTSAIIVCIIVSILCAIKVATTPYKNDLLGFVPYGARSREEFAIHDEYLNANGRSVLMMALIVAKDGGTVLKDEILREAVKNGFTVQMQLLNSNMSLNNRIALGYPVTLLYGRKMNIQSLQLFQANFYGINLVNDSSMNDTDMIDTIASISNMRSAKMIALIYRESSTGGWSDEEVIEYEMSIVKYFQRVYQPDHVKIYLMSVSFLDHEITRAGLSMLPYLIVGFAIMSLCSTFSTLISAAYMQQITIHKIYLAIIACICPFMASATAIGVLLLMGVRYGSILCITPFLVLAIGVDDAYLMIHAWQAVTKRCRNYPVKGDCEAYRLSEVLAESGPAILISALTNIFADAVGTFTGSPEITLLCYGNMASIFVDFIYQLTFYSAIMCIAGRFEMATETEQLNKHSIEIGAQNSTNLSNCCNQTACQLHDNVKHSCATLLNGYVKLITNGIFAFGVFCGWIIFVAFSIIGITRLKIELTTDRLFTQDSPMIEAVHLRTKYQASQYTMGQFYVNHPGDLSNPIRLQRLNEMVSELEHMDCSWGPESSNYFIRDFLSFEEIFAEEEEAFNEQPTSTENSQTAITFNEKHLKPFLEWPEYETWRGFTQINETRQVSAVRGDFNVSVFLDDAVYLDLIDNMPTDAWQSAVGTLACMAFICFVFLYDTFTVAVVSASILSIMTGIIGAASWMGIDLEPIMMAAMLISMGFSVDIPAHVSYHYNSAGAQYDRPITVEQRLRICLSAVALPAIQASLSTTLCVLGLLFIPLYMAQVFVKIMVTCITLCVLHGLLIIPCMFSLIDIVLSACHIRIYDASSSNN